MSELKVWILTTTIIAAITMSLILSGITNLKYSCEYDDQWMSSSGECIDPDTFLDAAFDRANG